MYPLMRARWLIIVLLFPLTLQAKHFFEIGLHGGLAAWDAQTTYVNSQLGYNAGAHIYYAYQSPYVIGLRTGLVLDHHNTGFGKTNYEDTYTTIDVEDQQMQIDYTIGTLTERSKIWSVGIPLQLSLTGWNCTLLAGAKAVLPLTATWHQKAENAALSVYYPAYDNRVYEAFPLAASRHFEMANDGNWTMPAVQWWIATELNYAIPVHRADRHVSYIVVGVYFDYCLSKLTPAQSDAQSLITLTDTRDGFPLSRILTPVIEATRQDAKLVHTCALFDLGIKLSYAISPYSPSRKSTSACRCW